MSEKIETILRHGRYNSRMKDFYDVYLFLTKLKYDLNIDVLKKAIDNTFVKREAFDYLNDYEQIIDSIIDSERINDLWKSYCKNNYYARNVEIRNILLLLKTFIRELNLQVIAPI